ncbi:MAG: FlgD immunoglobulin-like domain containing protein, partial [Ignavibacterium sp.]|uniref:FlgD immunoglobulin-like domain containing protein n=1 Tax=Ignavibacterium sp. TaxID=2651167 RepID=UPI0040493E93
FFVARDSIPPRFHITFDGREILDGDIISSEPVVLISLEDNSPLPLDTTLFTIVHNNVPIRFSNPDLSFSYTPYPNSKAEITWTPKLNDGKHVLEVLAKDASNNFFDTTSYRRIFYVYNDPDLKQVYNYPNPFKDDTYFTFELRGVNPPEEFRIKVFTIAGRLIREINIPPSSLQIGFNKIYWDGKDEDGNEIANGLYFYKIISKHGDEIKTVTQKLAKVK